MKVRWHFLGHRHCIINYLVALRWTKGQAQPGWNHQDLQHNLPKHHIENFVSKQVLSSFCSFLRCNEWDAYCAHFYMLLSCTPLDNLSKKGRKVWYPLTNQNRVKLTEIILTNCMLQTNLQNWVNTLNNSCQTSLYIIQTRWLKCLLVRLLD